MGLWDKSRNPDPGAGDGSQEAAEQAFGSPAGPAPAAEHADRGPTAPPTAIQRYEYRVDQLLETALSERIKPEDVAALLNHRAGEGWQLKTMVNARVGGTKGVGSPGLLVTFERPVGS